MRRYGGCLDDLSQNWHKLSSSPTHLFKSHKDPTQPTYSYVRVMYACIYNVYIYIWILHGFAHFDFGESWGSGSTPKKCAEVARSISSTSSKLYQGNHQSGARCNKGCRWCNVILQVLLDGTALSCVANVACTIILLFKNHIHIM